MRLAVLSVVTTDLGAVEDDSNNNNNADNGYGITRNDRISLAYGIYRGATRK